MKFSFATILAVATIYSTITSALQNDFASDEYTRDNRSLRGSTMVPPPQTEEAGEVFDDKTIMNNLGVTLKGYDVYRGNPMVRGQTDPGFKSAIFAADYKTASRWTSDGRYRQPIGIDILSISNCHSSYTSDVRHGERGYYDSLSAKVAVSGAGWGAKFKASTSYQKATETLSKSRSIVTQSEATCAIYQSRVLAGTPPPFSVNFRVMLSQLPLDYDSNREAYERFIDEFGTHYLKSANMGSTWGESSILTESSVSKLQSEGVNVKAAAKYSAMSYSMGASLNLDKESEEKMSEFQSNAEQHVYSRGERPRDNDKDWASTVAYNPSPVSFKVAPITDLYLLPYVKDSRVVENLFQAMAEYCPRLQANGEVQDCSEPAELPESRPPSVVKSDSNHTCYWGNRFSEENQPFECRPQYLAAGMQCSGKYCDTIRLLCLESFDDYSNSTWSPFISEETQGRRINEFVCDDGDWVTGFACDGSYCNNLSVRCTRASYKGETVKSKSCAWGNLVNPDLPTHYLNNQDPKGLKRYIRGVRCYGSFCRTKKFFECSQDVDALDI